MATPKGAETVVGIASPRGKKAVPNVYTHLGHGSEMVAGDAIPVPAGCVYVTFTLCGEVSKDSYRILKAFEDPAVKDLLTTENKEVHTADLGSQIPIDRDVEDPNENLDLTLRCRRVLRVFLDFRDLFLISFLRRLMDR